MDAYHFVNENEVNKLIEFMVDSRNKNKTENVTKTLKNNKKSIIINRVLYISIKHLRQNRMNKIRIYFVFVCFVCDKPEIKLLNSPKKKQHQQYNYYLSSVN